MYETGFSVPAAAEKKNIQRGFLNWCKDHIGADDIRVIPADELLRNNGLKKTTLLLIMGNLGCGIISAPYAFHQVGFILGVTISFVMVLVSWYLGVLLTEVFVENQDCHSLGALAERLGGPRYSRLIYSGVYLYIFVQLSYFLLVAAKAIQDIREMCIYTAALYSGLIVLPFFQLRTLSEISYLGIFAFLTIFVVIVICLQQAGEYKVDVTHSWLYTGSVYEIFSATGTIGFAYNAHMIYPEMMYEMQDPKEFVTVLNIGMPFLFATYTTTGVLGYYLAGDGVPAYLLDVIPSGSMRSAAAIFMIIHLIFSMLPRAQILTRVLHRKLDIASVDAFHHTSEMFWRATIYWFQISIILYIAMFLVLNTIPYFDDLVILMGCLFEPLINLTTPTVLFWLLRRKRGQLMSISMKIGFFFGGLLASGLLIFGTLDSVSDWLQHTADIWTCNPY